jgi:hypothetical protein
LPTYAGENPEVYEVAVIVNGSPAAAAGNATAPSERTLSAMAANKADKRAVRDVIPSVQSWVEAILPGRTARQTRPQLKTMLGDDGNSMAWS